MQENRRKKNTGKTATPCKYRAFRFALIITCGYSYAVASLESGDDIKTVQTNLGHATASFTLDVYGHVSQKMRQQSAERMEQFIHSVSSSKGHGKG